MYETWYDAPMTASWETGFSAAKLASEQSNGRRPGQRLGAALFSGPRLLSIGYNLYGKSTSSHRWSTHAEIMALVRRKHYDDDKNLVLYVYREVRDHVGKVSRGSCRPCPECLAYINQSPVKTVRFFENGGQPWQIKL